MPKKKNLIVFYEVQAALLNSECDPADACAQALVAFYMFAATEWEGSTLAALLKRGLGVIDLRPTLRAKLEEARLL